MLMTVVTLGLAATFGASYLWLAFQYVVSGVALALNLVSRRGGMATFVLGPCTSTRSSERLKAFSDALLVRSTCCRAI